MFTIIGCFLAVLAAEGALAAEPKFAAVNIQEVLDTVDEGKHVKSRIESEVLAKKRDIDEKRKAYEKLEIDFDRQKLTLPSKALEDKQKELAIQREEFQRYFLSAQADMQKREIELTRDILDKVQAVITKVGKEEGYSMVWEKRQGGVLYLSDALDITDRVIAEYNRQSSKKD